MKMEDWKKRNHNQSGLLNQEEQPSIIILWVGGVGSAAAFCLAKMWFQDITLVDKDEVALHNTSSQMFKTSDIWRSKVETLADTIKEFSEVECNIINERWDEELAKDKWEYDICILWIDNMDFRKRVVDYYTQDPFCTIIESRMWWTEYIIQVVEDYMIWLASWFPQSEADPENCTAKSICFNTFLIGGKIGELVWKIVMKKPYKNYNAYDSLAE